METPNRELRLNWELGKNPSEIDKILYHIYQSEGMVDVDLQLEKTGMSAGVYFIKLYDENELLGATKFIKQ